MRAGGTVSASIRRRWTRVRERPTRAAPHRRCDGAPAPVLRRHGPRVPRAGGPRARPPLRPAPAASALACRRQTCGTRAGPNSAAGRRGRRRSAYEAPRAAADGGTRLGGAESKRRRRPRLPAPPSRVTLLGRTREARATIWQRGCRRAPPDRSPQPERYSDRLLGAGRRVAGPPLEVPLDGLELSRQVADVELRAHAGEEFD